MKSNKDRRDARQDPGTLTRRAVFINVAGWSLALCVASTCSPATMTPRVPAQRVVMPADFDHVVDLHVGDVVVVRRPMNADEWQVLFDPSFLEHQGDEERLRKPDRDGWTFKAVHGGDTSLTVTPVLRGGANPPRFTVSFHIQS